MTQQQEPRTIVTQIADCKARLLAIRAEYTNDPSTFDRAWDLFLQYSGVELELHRMRALQFNAIAQILTRPTLTRTAETAFMLRVFVEDLIHQLYPDLSYEQQRDLADTLLDPLSLPVSHDHYYEGGPPNYGTRPLSCSE